MYSPTFPSCVTTLLACRKWGRTTHTFPGIGLALRETFSNPPGSGSLSFSAISEGADTVCMCTMGTPGVQEGVYSINILFDSVTTAHVHTQCGVSLDPTNRNFTLVIKKTPSSSHPLSLSLPHENWRLDINQLLFSKTFQCHRTAGELLEILGLEPHNINLCGTSR